MFNILTRRPQALLVPPAIALVLLLLYTHVVLPLYRSRQRYAQYLPVVPVPAAPSIIGRTRARVQDAFTDFIARARGENRRSMDADDMFGDEELEEGVDALHGVGEGRRGGEAVWDGGGRRLSRELEAGFRDDSDEDEAEPERARGRR